VSARRLLALVAALALALVVVACGGDSGGGSGGGDDSATALIKRATQNTAKSADMKLDMEVNVKGVDNFDGPAKLSLEGPFRSNGKGALPDLDWKMHGEADGKKFDARLITLRDNAYVEYQDTTYEVGTQLISTLTSRMKQQSQADPKELRSLGINAGSWLKDAEVEDSDVDGVATKRISGEVDVRKAMQDLDKLFRKLSSSNQLPSGSSPQITDQTIDQVTDAIKDPHIEVDVGRDDGIMRRETAEFGFEVPEDKRASAKGLEGGNFKLSFEFRDVNGDQQVQRPTGARPIAELLQRIGIPPQMLLGPGFSTPAPG
jgi:hypothetical protein